MDWRVAGGWIGTLARREQDEGPDGDGGEESCGSDVQLTVMVADPC